MVLLSITVLVFNGKDIPVLSSVRAGAVDALTPVQRWVASVTRPVRSWFGSATEYDNVVAENQQLRDEVERLKALAITNSDAQVQLQQLQEQNNLSYAKDVASVIAQVTPGAFSNFDDYTIQIDKGSDDKLAKNMPVVTNGGLVGRISEVTPHNALVRLVTDPELVVSVKLAGTGDYALGRGAGKESPFTVFEGVELTDPVEIGESVLTSGLGKASFPAGIPVGSVTKVEQSDSGQSQLLQVRTGADLARLGVVKVLIWEPEQ